MKKHLNVFTVIVIGFGMLTNNFAQKSRDYTSKVPKFNFANTLEEQKEQLKMNSLLLRFMESRKRLANDRYRPIYHYVNPEGKPQ